MYTNLDNCIVCENELVEVIDLTEQPLANDFHKKNEIINKYPLKLMVCSRCFHSQLSVSVSPNILFKNYIYVSGTTKSAHEYFEKFSHKIDKTCKQKNILDIACNDSTQLDYFKKLGWNTYGIDPAKNLKKISENKGHNIICDYFNTQTAKRYSDEKIKFDVILAQNVFAHTKDIHNFVEGVKMIMDDETDFYIQTSQANMIDNVQFDTVYHEHISFFSSMSMNKIITSDDLYLNNIEIMDVHGGSYLFKINKFKDENNNLKEFIEKESKLGRYDLKTYVDYGEKCLEFKSKLTKIIHSFDNKILVGYGAAAKGNTILNFCNIKLNYIVDENSLKQNLFSPGMNIPIKDFDYLMNDEREKIVIPIAWNYYDEIKRKLINVKKYKLMRYYPNIEIDDQI